MSLAGMHRETGKGPYRHQWANWKGGLAVADGDLVYRDQADGYDKSAALFTWNASLVQTQTDFKQAFRGVSTVRRTTAQTLDGDQASDGPILASGEFTFPCAALGVAAKIGPTTYIAIAQGTGNSINPAKVVVTNNVSLAIGRLTRDAAVGATELTFEIVVGNFDSGVTTIS